MTQEHRFFQILETLRLTARKSITLAGERITSWQDLIQDQFQYISEVTTGDDKGVKIQGGQFSVGAPGDGRESVFGEGDSYPVPLAFHCTVGNTTDLVITDAVDVSTALQSDSGSTTGLFDGVTAGNYLLVGADATFGGVKAKIETAGTVEPDKVIGEYLVNDVPSWVEAPFMVTDADYPYAQYAHHISQAPSKKEQWRFGFNPLSLPVTWAKVALTINGTEYTKYWGRFRITSEITSDVLMQQIKLHTNRMEINADGTSEYFGRSRYPKAIPVLKYPNAVMNPANEQIKVATGITQVRLDNEFKDTAKDGLVLEGIIPEGMDTSIPAVLTIDWYAKGTGSGNVELELETIAAVATEGFTYDGNATPTASTPVVTAIDNQEEVLQQTIFLVDNANALPGDKIYGSLFRDATVGNTHDTLSASVVITGYRVIGYFWRP